MRIVKTISSHKKLAAGIIAVILVIIAVAFIVTITTQNNNDKKASTAIIKDTGYATILPAGKDITSLGGWEQISPPSTSPVYAYTDTIGSVSINVSQQPLPDTFKNDTANQIAQLAESYSAAESVDANGAKVYIGTSAKGPQSIIFTKSNLLILIKSQQKIETKALVAYINSLQ